jgi:Flp pilus assembly protein TadD
MTGDHDADIRWCREALQRDPRFVPALKGLAAAATAKGSLTDAVEALARSVALRPGDGSAFADLGNVYLRLNRVDDAQKALRQALALDPAMPQANNTMGLVASRQGTATSPRLIFAKRSAFRKVSASKSSPTARSAA